MTIDDVLAADLPDGREVPTATSGEPYEQWLVLHDDGRVELGIWEVTPGSFASEKIGVYESMHVVAGAGTITSADGTVTELRPGVVMLCEDGWAGEWEVRKTIRKTYTVVRTSP
ncbi:MAG TPA: cupin domain-containing protein [Gaiellaceae bacterium]|nr:cupin domain-containing protein [Gaiellaceae bacterium]